MAGLLLAALSASSWWWVAISLLALARWRCSLSMVAARSSWHVGCGGWFREPLPRVRPDFVVYTSRPDDASYQVMMWLPYLKRAGLRFIIVARNAVPAAALAELTDVPVVEARGIADLDALVVPSLKAAFYVNASSGNGALVRFQHLTHIYLGHGDSDKPPSYNPTHAMYDQIFAAGPGAPFTPPTGCGSRAKVHDRRQAPGRERQAERLGSQMSRSRRCCTRRRGGGHVEETMLYSLLG